MLIGRGPSFDPEAVPDDVTIAAVASAVFICPRTPDLWLTWDAPRYFEQTPDTSGWQHDHRCKWWDVFTPELPKHIPAYQNVPGKEVLLDKFTVHDAIPMELVHDLMRNRADFEGFRHGWADFENVHPWETDDDAPPSFDREGVIGKDGKRSHSLLFAVQVVARLGFKRVMFNGCDCLKGLSWVSEALDEWQPLAEAAGIEWIRKVNQCV